jgi:hypothetical protein
VSLLISDNLDRLYLIAYKAKLLKWKGPWLRILMDVGAFFSLLIPMNSDILELLKTAKKSK